MNETNANDFQAAQDVSHEQVRTFLSVLDPKLHQQDDRLLHDLSMENSSAKSKLGKLYRFLEAVGKEAEPYIACGKGCSGCCKMNVSITSVEAERLATLSGKRIARGPFPVSNHLEKYVGVPCPFLIEDKCSVYDACPYACRAHFSFDTSSYWCQPERPRIGDGYARI
jgi:Fe-S-cluster containining protein